MTVSVFTLSVVCGCGGAVRCAGADPQRMEDPADRGRAYPVAELGQLARYRRYPQPWFSVASRSMSAVISALTGGRPVRFG